MASHGKSPSTKKIQQSGSFGSNKGPSKSAKSRPAVTQKATLLQKMDEWFAPRLNTVFYLSLAFTVLFGALLFDVKISTGGDDSHYIEMANDFIRGRAFPSWHGPLYPIFLSLPMLFFGVKVVMFKLFSFAFIIAHLILFFYTFRRLISPTVFTLVLLIISVNSTILYFASQTYSEAMYMFLQALMIFLFVNIYNALQSDESLTIKNQLLYWVVLGFFVFLASLTRNIGIVALMVMILFLLIEKKFLQTVLLLGSYLLFLLPFRLYKSLVWNTGRSGSSEFSEILLKNPYNQAQGSEDFAGMVTRFFENARLYLSKHFMIGIGLHDPASTSKSAFVTLIVIVLFLMSLYYAYKRSKIFLFVALYLGGSVSATFIALQQQWDQMRMVVIYIPMLLLFLSWGITQLDGNKRYGFLATLLPFFLVFVFFKTFGQTADKMKTNQKILQKNLSGNIYYGFTPDWQNFLLMSQWVGKHLPDSDLVASRKPSMSFIYSGGREFYGMYRFPMQEPSKLVNGLRSRVGDMLVIPQKAFEKNIPPVLQETLRQAAVGYVAEGNDIYGLYRNQDPGTTLIRKALTDYHLETITPDSLLNRVQISNQTCFAVSPDTLLNNLRRGRVKYVIVASLRANPNVNNGNIINTIQRYLYFIQLKYPGILSLVEQIGNGDAEEPTWLYKLNYAYYKL